MGIETLIATAAIASIGSTVLGGIQSYNAAGTQAQGAQVASQGELVAAEGSRVAAEGSRAAARGALTQAEGARIAAEGGVKASQARSQAALYRAAVARNNQQLAKQYSAMETTAGLLESEKAGLRTRQNLGTAKAIQASSGLDVSSGSAKDVRDSIKDLGDLDAATIRSNASKRAFGYDITATQQGASAELADMESRAETESQGYITKAGEYTAKGYESAAEGYEYAAKGHEYAARGHEFASQGQQYRAQGYEDAGTASLIGTAGSVSDKWLSYQTKGVNYGAAFGGNSGNAFLPSPSFMNNQWGY